MPPPLSPPMPPSLPPSLHQRTAIVTGAGRGIGLAIAQTLRAHCEAKGVSLAHFATAWVLANPHISSVIAGPRTLAQWQDYFGAIEVQITAEDEALVNSLVSPGHSSTPGYNDPAYPLAGR